MDYSKIRSWLRFPYSRDRVFSAIFFAVAFVPLIFTNYLNDNIELPKLALWAICIAVALIAWLRQAARTGVKYNKWIVILVCLFVLWSIVSTIFSLDVVNGIVGLYGRFTGSVLFYGLWGLTLLLMIGTLTREKFIFLCKTLVFVSLLIVVFGILQTYGFAYYGGIDEPARSLVPSFMGNPNFSSMFIASVLPLALLLLAKARTGAARIYYGTASLLILIGLAFFGSRGSLLAAFAALVVMAGIGVIIRAGWKFVSASVVGLALMVLIGGLFLNVLRPEVVGQTIQLSELTVDQRFAAWDVTLNIIRHYPLFGTGPGSYFIGFNQFSNSVFSTAQRFDDAHNLFLHIAASTGLPSVVLFAAILALAAWLGWRALRASGDPLYLALLAAGVAWVISTSFNPVVTGVWLLLAIILAGLTLDATSLKTSSIPRAGRFTLTALGILVIIYSLSSVASDAFALRAQAFYHERQYARSQRFARLAVYLNPANPVVSSYWAASRIKLGQLSGSTDKVINFLVALHPRSPRVQADAATLSYLLYNQTHDEAYKAKVDQYLQTTVRVEPNQASIDVQVAYLYYKLGNRDQAMFYTRQSLINDPRQIYSWILLAQMYQEQGKREPMIFALTQAQRVDSSLALLKNTIQAAQNQPDINKIKLPVTFPDPDIY